MKNERPYGALHKYRRRTPRSPRRTTANRTARRERESPISPPCGARRECRRRAPRSPRDTTATLAARRERESPIGTPCGARRECRRRALRNPRDTTEYRKYKQRTISDAEHDYLNAIKRLGNINKKESEHED